MIVRTCQHCGKDYDTFPSIPPKYCSSQCAGAAKQRGAVTACPVCGATFYSPPSAGKHYCSKSCARTARNLTDENPAFHRDITGENNPMYGRGLAGPANAMYGKRRAEAPTWKGGRKIRKDGYVLAVAPDDHPYPADMHEPSGLKYVLEHRLVMERRLGRSLRPEEVVHHIDENPSNNDPSNLQLFANQAEHMLHGHGGRSTQAPAQAGRHTPR